MLEINTGSYFFFSFLLGVRAVVEPHSRAYSRIVYHFGPEILLENGQIDRQKLGLLIFASEEKRKLLNSITHPEIHKAMLKEILMYFLKGEKQSWKALEILVCQLGFC